MRGERIEVKHRIKGRPALVRSLRGLLIRVHRFANGRARTPADLRWSVLMLDALQTALDVDARDERGEGSR